MRRGVLFDMLSMTMKSGTMANGTLESWSGIGSSVWEMKDSAYIYRQNLTAAKSREIEALRGRKEDNDNKELQLNAQGVGFDDYLSSLSSELEIIKEMRDAIVWALDKNIEWSLQKDSKWIYEHILWNRWHRIQDDIIRCKQWLEPLSKQVRLFEEGELSELGKLTEALRKARACDVEELSKVEDFSKRLRQKWRLD